jgi:hypothetical protein
LERQHSRFFGWCSEAGEEDYQVSSAVVRSDHAEPLVMLNKLSNIDKHRHCDFGLACSRGTVFRIHCRDGSAVEITPRGLLYLGEVHSYALRIDRALVASGARVESAGTLVITFKEDGPWGDTPIMQVLENCFDHIQRTVIGPLTPFFRPVHESTVSV